MYVLTKYRETRILRDSIFCIAIFLYVFFAHPITTHAQALLTGNTGVNLISQPQFPGPNTEVTISLDDYSIDTAGANIAWYLDSIEQPTFRNARATIIKTGDLGKKVTVRVALTRNNLPPLTASLDIIPTKIDVILESNTYTPSFYQGRALPSNESNVRAIVVVHDGTEVLDTSYTYTWSLGEKVLLGGPIKGKNILTFTMPHYDDERLSVEVFAPNGKIVGKQSLVLKSSKPELHFYEQSPLRGLFNKEVTDPLQLIGEETTLYGEPYFMNLNNANDDSAEFSWAIDGTKTAHDATSKNAITLRHVGGKGSASLSLAVVNNKNIPQFVKKAFQIIFE